MKLKEALDTYMFDNVGQFGYAAELSHIVEHVCV